MKILLVDDHVLFRDGVAFMIAREFPQWRLLQAGSLSEAEDILGREPDIALVLLDLGLPDSKGLEGLTYLYQCAPRPNYVVISALDTREVILEAIDCGAAGFIPKTTQAKTMFDALREVIRGNIFLPSLALGSAASDLLPRALREMDRFNFSPRQADVMRLLARGCSNKQICRHLNIAESTVKTHLEIIYRKLGAKSRTQAVLAAARLGFRLESVSA